MAMKQGALQLANGKRQPTQPVRRRGSEWRGFHRAFDHELLAQALSGFGVARVRTR